MTALAICVSLTTFPALPFGAPEAAFAVLLFVPSPAAPETVAVALVEDVLVEDVPLTILVLD